MAGMDAVQGLAISTGRPPADVRQMLLKLGYGLSFKEASERARAFVAAVNQSRTRL